MIGPRGQYSQPFGVGINPCWSAALSLLILPIAASSAQAASINVVNPGFEDITGEAPFNEFTFGPLNGWDLYDPTNITDGGDGPTYFIGTLTPFEPDPVGNPGVFANFPAGAAEGQRVAIAFNFQNSGGQGEYGLVQTLTDTLQPHTAYRLQVEVGNIASATAMSGQFFDLDGFPGYRVDLLAGDIVIASDNNSLAGAIAEGAFAASTVTFATGATHAQFGQPLGIRLVNLNEVDPLFMDSDLEVDFDDVRLDATPVLAGDFNNDGTVNAADYTVWRDHLGAADESALGGNGDGINGVDVGDYALWTTNFGATSGASSRAGASSPPAVPEPAGFVLLALLKISCLLNLRRP